MARSQAVSTAQVASSPSANNPIINGAFDIWQRGTSFSLASAASPAYNADRWMSNAETNAAATVSRQVATDSTNLPNIQYCLRYQRNSGQTGTGTNTTITSFETVNSIPFAGKTITLSFYARAGANYSATSGALNYKLFTGTGTDQNAALVTYTGNATPINQTATLTTTWQRFSASATLSSTLNEMAIAFNFSPTGTAGAADYYEITGVQIDIGSVALPFRRTMSTLQGELAACQRYYYRNNPGVTYKGLGTGMAYSTTAGIIMIPFPVEMRTRPTAIEQSGTATDYVLLNSSGSNVNCNGVPTFDATTSKWAGWFTVTVASGLTAGNATHCTTGNSTTGYLGWSAEL